MNQTIQVVNAKLRLFQIALRF